MYDPLKYQKLKEDSQKFYNNIGSIFSPNLKEKVIFPAEGFNHIIFKKYRSERDRSSQLMRFKLLPIAKKLISLSTTHQEFEETIKEFNIKKYKNRAKEYRIVKYWGIIAIIDGWKIKVIIRKVGENGSLHFWSIIPAWTTNKYRDTKFISMMKGDPEED